MHREEDLPEKTLESEPVKGNNIQDYLGVKKGTIVNEQTLSVHDLTTTLKVKEGDLILSSPSYTKKK